MTNEQRIESLVANLSDGKQVLTDKIIAIYKDEYSYWRYGGYIDCTNVGRFKIYDVMQRQEIKTLGSNGGKYTDDQISAIFFGAQFILEKSFREKVIDAMDKLNFSQNQAKIYIHETYSYV